jgi:small subunit ribosomal protein S2
MLKLKQSVFFLLTKEQLFRSRVYLGHGSNFWHVENCKFVALSYKTSSIIDINFTVLHFKRALSFLLELKKRQRWMKILFVNGLPFFNAVSDLRRVRRLFFKCPEPYVLRWLPGLLTNLNKVYRRLLLSRNKPNRLRKVRSNKRAWLQESSLGLRKLENYIPSLVIFLSIVQHYALCLHETAVLRIPTIGIVDTDGSFNNVVYPIIGNDDSFYSCFLYLEVFINAVRLGMRSAIMDEFVALNPIKTKRNNKCNDKNKTDRWNTPKFFVRGLLWNLIRKFKLKVANKYHQVNKQQLIFYFAENKFGKGRLADIKLLKIFNSFFSNRQVGLRFFVK